MVQFSTLIAKPIVRAAELLRAGCTSAAEDLGVTSQLTSSAVLEDFTVESFENGALQILKRKISLHCQPELQALSSINFPHISLKGSPDLVLTRLARKIQKLNLSEEAAAEFYFDIKQFIRYYVSSQGISRIGVLLTVSHPGISEPEFTLTGFHRDKSKERLLCWYTGYGFDWLPKEAVDLPAFEKYYKTGIETNFASTDSIVATPKNCAAMFNGREIIHRKPRTSEFRLLFSVDAV